MRLVFKMCRNKGNYVFFFKFLGLMNEVDNEQTMYINYICRKLLLSFNR